MARRALIVCVLICLLLVACSPDAAVEPTPAPTLALIPATPTATPTPVQPTATPADLSAPSEISALTPTVVQTAINDAPLEGAALTARDPIAAGFVALARQQMADELDLPLARIFLVDARPVVWSDTSLNCPLPDVVYAQVQVPGYRIVVRAGRREFLFHTDADRLVPCAFDNEQLPPDVRAQIEGTPEATAEITAEATDEATAEANAGTRQPTIAPTSGIVG